MKQTRLAMIFLMLTLSLNAIAGWYEVASCDNGAMVIDRMDTYSNYHGNMVRRYQIVIRDHNIARYLSEQMNNFSYMNHHGELVTPASFYNTQYVHERGGRPLVKFSLWRSGRGVRLDATAYSYQQGSFTKTPHWFFRNCEFSRDF